MPMQKNVPAAGAATKRYGARGAVFCRALVWLALCCALAPFVYALGFCFPRGDDFDEVTRAMFLFDLPGGLYEIGREWLTWSGRYTYHFLAVFLGKAGELRWAYGLICGGVMALYGVAFAGLARQAGARAGDAALLGGLAVLALCACHQHLWTFYLLTDALTMGLQPAAALLFFWSLCRFWTALDRETPAWPGGDGPCSAPAARRARRAAIILGVLAVGVFEHSALAVLLGTGIFCVLAFARDARHGLSPGRMLRGPGHLRAALPIALWCLGAALFSFLAPGNQQRRSARCIDAAAQQRQLDAVWSDWTDAVAAFGDSLWPVAVAGLVAFLLLARRRPSGTGLSRTEHLLLALMAAAGFVLWSLGLTLLHALSDVPVNAVPKLPAGLAQYAACALGFTLYAVVAARRAVPPPERSRGARAAALLLALGLVALFCRSGNFLRTATNAVNGGMVFLADAQETRDAWLRRAGGEARADDGPRFGLMGEILRPGVRARRLDPTLPLVVVQAETAPVFPVHNGEALPENPEHWPNLWVAWMYGVGGVASARPDPARAVAAVSDPGAAPVIRDGDPLPLALPPALRHNGVDGAWRVTASGGPNPTFADTWLVMACRQALPGGFSLFRPAPPDRRRLAPFPAQAWLLRRLERQTPPDAAFPDRLDRCAGALLRFSPPAWATATETGFFYAFPLGSENEAWPLPLFVRLDGRTAWLALGPEHNGGPSAR